MQRLPARSISPVTTALASVQWLFFMFANIVVIPISLGYAFHQPPAVITCIGYLAHPFVKEALWAFIAASFSLSGGTQP